MSDLECRAYCPLQLACQAEIAEIEIEKDGVYKDDFRHEETLSAIYAQIDVSDEEIAKLALQSDELLDNLAEGESLKKVSAEMRESKLAKLDGYVANIEAVATSASNLCRGPVQKKKYHIFGEEVIKCRSLFGASWLLFKLINRLYDDTAAEYAASGIEDGGLSGS